MTPDPRERVARQGRLVLLAVATVGVLSSLALAGLLLRQADERAVLRFAEAAEAAADLLVDEVDAGVSLAESVAALVAAEPDIDLSAYRAFVDQLGLAERFPSATGLALTEVADVDDVDGFLNRLAARGRPDLVVVPDEPIGDERWVIVFNEPESVNAAAIGLDIRSRLPALEAATEAARAGEPRMTSPLTLVQEQGDQAGLVAYAPFRRSDSGGGRLAGFGSIIFRGGQLLEEVFGAVDPLRVTVADAGGEGGLDGAGTIAVYDPRPSTTGPLGRQAVLTRQVVGRPWTITVHGLGRFGTPLLAPGLALLVSLLLTASLISLVRSLQQRGTRAQQLTDLATADLRRSEQELARTNAELASANADLEQTNAELARSNAELARYAHVASHDLKEPVRMVSGFAGLLRTQLQLRDGDGALTELEAEALAQVEKGARRMQTLISDLLELASIDQNPSLRERVDIAQHVQDLLELFGPDIAETGGSVRLGVLDPVVMDPRQVRGLLQNLLSNALKFRRPGVAPVVTIDAVATPGSWTLRVTDNGIGIPPEDRALVFEAFRRMHSRDSYDGTGIGLAICQQVAIAHGGGVSIEDGHDGGTAVVVTLPQGDRAPLPG